jgi:hypothetical protein
LYNSTCRHTCKHASVRTYFPSCVCSNLQRVWHPGNMGFSYVEILSVSEDDDEFTKPETNWNRLTVALLIYTKEKADSYVARFVSLRAVPNGYPEHLSNRWTDIVITYMFHLKGVIRVHRGIH